MPSRDRPGDRRGARSELLDLERQPQIPSGMDAEEPWIGYVDVEGIVRIVRFQQGHWPGIR